MSDLRLGICGLSHLGLIYSTAFTTFGVETVCYDSDDARVKKLAGGGKTIDEPNLYETIAKNGARQTFTSNIAAIKNCDIVYIALDVATDNQGNSDLGAVRQMIETVKPNLRDDAILVVLCQVTPGFTRELSKTIPQKVYYQVETLVFGRAMERALKPERYIVGTPDPGKNLDLRFENWLKRSQCPIIAMSYESAELSKIAINLFLISSVSTSNLLAELCEKIGADWADIKPSLQLDKRIGPHAYLKPGLGISGGNLERDMMSVVKLGERHKTDTRLVQTWMDQSGRRKLWVVERVKELFPDRAGLKLAMWGLAYKEDTNSIKNSPAIETIQALPECEIVAHDPSVDTSQLPFTNVTYVGDPLAALEDADALLVMTPWPQYKGFSASEIAGKMSGEIIIDPYGMLDTAQDGDSPVTVYVMGKAPVSLGGEACSTSRKRLL